MAERLGTSITSARRWAGKLGYTYKDDQSDMIAAIRQLPPNLTRAEIIERLGWSEVSAWKYCKLAGYAPRRARRIQNEKWSEVDWTQTNLAIARTLNVSRELVRLRRKEFGKPRR